VKIEFSKDADAIYISLHEEDVARSREIEDGVVADFNADGRLIGIEVLDVSKRYETSDISSIQIENILREAV
jgi:uncharacterized protein YuzE